MRIRVLHNLDHDTPAPGKEARADVLRVAEAVTRALRAAGHATAPLGVGDDPLTALAALRGPGAPDLVFNLCESLGGDARDEAGMAAALQLLRIPFTGSDALTLALALHKDRAKALLRQHGVPTPDWWVVEPGAAPPAGALPYPLIVKPAREDGSLGIALDSVVTDRTALQAALRRVWALGQPALVEAYVDGREVMVSFLGNAPRQLLPLREIAFGPAFDGRPRIVSYLAKWDPASPECVDSASVSCALPRELEARACQAAQQALAALGCQDFGRVDLRLSRDGVPYVIDVNPNCDLNPEAGYARAAAEAGLDYVTLISRIAEAALARAVRAPPDAAAPGGGSGGAGRAAAAGHHLHLR